MKKLTGLERPNPDPYELLPSGVPTGIHNALVEALGIDDEEVRCEAALKRDLAVESIDRLDIVFKLERAYNIQIPMRDLMPEDILFNDEYVSERLVNKAGVKALRQRMPYADLSSFEEEPRVDRFFEAVHSVDFLKRYLQYRGIRFVKPTQP